MEDQRVKVRRALFHSYRAIIFCVAACACPWIKLSVKYANNLLQYFGSYSLAQ